MDFKCIPTRHQHNSRNRFNKTPTGLLTHAGQIDQYNQKVYTDENGNEWHLLKWYHSIFHNPIKNLKFQYYHCDEHPNVKECSSEIIVPKKYVEHEFDGTSKIHSVYVQDGSFNFKDFKKTNHIAHFFADILPTALYCSCIGK